MSWTRLETSLGSVCASFFLFVAGQQYQIPRSELTSVELTVNSNITECSGAVVLHICILGTQQAY
jgi:hypothetical protein